MDNSGDKPRNAGGDDSNATHCDKAPVLVVEDEAPLLRLLKFLLERQGYTLITATDGDAVLPLMYTHRPRLVILDIMLPNRDGIDLLQAIRGDSVLCETPVIVLSAKAQEADIARGLSVGADLYITKPFRPEMLTETIGGFLPLGPPAALTC